MSNRFKPKFNIKKGDSVVVISGDDKDLKKARKVLEVYPDASKVLVEGVNIVTRHTKPSAQNTKGGLVKKEAPDPHLQYPVVGCEIGRSFESPSRKAGRKISSDLKKIRGGNQMSTVKYTPRLAEKYKKEVVPALMKKFGYKTVMQAPKLEKICINRGVNGAVTDKKLVEVSVEELSTITGQKAVTTQSQKDISNFKLRKNMPIGARVTLRGEKMYEFLDRLVSTALPRVRDFRGINEKSFDGRGNYTLGITEQIIFPEIDIDKVNKITGMDITFVTTAGTNEEAFELLKELGMPFRNIKKD